MTSATDTKAQATQLIDKHVDEFMRHHQLSGNETRIACEAFIADAVKKAAEEKKNEAQRTLKSIHGLDDENNVNNRIGETVHAASLGNVQANLKVRNGSMRLDQQQLKDNLRTKLGLSPENARVLVEDSRLPSKPSVALSFDAG